MRQKNIFFENSVVKDNAALIGKNTLISIAEVRPINLSELEADEKLNLFFQYQYFIRSLKFPVQIVLRFVNRDCDKFLYRKRMANVEETIKTIYKKNYKDVIAESDEFKRWLKCFLELSVRPMLLCYFVIPVYADNNLIKNETAYIESLQLLNQRTDDCISKLSSIKFKKKIKSNTKRSEWEQEQLENINEKKALIALKMFRKKENYYSFNNFRAVNDGKRKIDKYIKNNSFYEITDEKEINLELTRLDESKISNLFDSYSKDFIVLNTEGYNQYLSVKELFSLWTKPLLKGD